MRGGTRYPIRVVLLGYHNDAMRTLQMLLRKKCVELCALILPSNRPRTMLRPFEELADQHNISWYCPKQLRGHAEVESTMHDADVAFSISYTKIIPKEWCTLPKHGCINLHESLLPKYRGSHPLNWAIINGETETGVTAHFMTEELDAGDIALQERVSIEESDTVATLDRKTSRITVNLVEQIVDMLGHGKVLPRYPQDETQATFCRPRRPEDGQFEWAWSSRRICNMVRGLAYPWPGAIAKSCKGELTIWEALPVDEDLLMVEIRKVQPGMVLRVQPKGVLVAAGGGAVKIMVAGVRGADYPGDDLAKLFSVGEVLA